MYEKVRVLRAVFPSSITSVCSRKTRYGIIGVGVFAALTVVGANIYIPMRPVPVTLQTLFVLLAGAVVGGRYGTLSQLLYVGGGAVGLPLFAGHLGGLGILAGPTGGYLASFLVVPFIVGTLIHRSQTLLWQIAVFSLGTVVIFAFGVGHLAVLYTNDFSTALHVGLLPFIPGAILKIAAAISITRSYSALIRLRRSSGAE